METDLIYFIYGLCVMFYGMMAWFFYRKGADRLSRLVMLLMAVLAAGCVKDVFFIPMADGHDTFLWTSLSAIDMVAVPLYAFVLIELCRPGWLTRRTMLLHEMSFVILALLFMTTREKVFFDAETVWAAIYGFGYASWTVWAIPRYHRHLMEAYSYYESINLNWLRTILFSYFIILSLWIIDCVFMEMGIGWVYMLGSLIIWMFVCWFIYRHESVIDELREHPVQLLDEYQNEEQGSELGRVIRRLFEVDMIFLNRQLKLSDVVRMSGSNRTYVSRFFNGEEGTSFFEYVNGYRVRYAEELLKNTDDKIETIAEKSGFSSRQSFHRVFLKLKGCTPETMRTGRANR